MLWSLPIDVVAVSGVCKKSWADLTRRCEFEFAPVSEGKASESEGGEIISALDWDFRSAAVRGAEDAACR
jgi:hypothetical protein